MAGLLAACAADVGYDGTRYMCPDQRCPDGFTCVDGFCERGGPGDPDPDADAPPRPDGGLPGDRDAGAPGPLVLVPPGDFYRGCDIGFDQGCALDTMPAGPVSLSLYLIEAHEVTWGAWEDCVLAGACPDVLGPPAPGQALLPASGMSHDEAVGYCAWIGRRLPTEAEWERAARGVDARLYPWGDAPPDCSRVTFDGCGPGPTPVASRLGDVSPVGARDMSGNVAEWVSDWYAPGYLGDVDPQGPPGGNDKVLRGGSVFTGEQELRTFWREHAPPGTRAPDIGFRCASD
jgi:formylglycine-generating enzyme required for sulfatase activity